MGPQKILDLPAKCRYLKLFRGHTLSLLPSWEPPPLKLGQLQKIEQLWGLAEHLFG